jgi:hypothetical protein
MKKYLKFYEECMTLGELPNHTIEGDFCMSNGLCDSLSFHRPDPLFELFEPTEEDIKQLNANYLSAAYWASDEGHGSDFGPTRQNIVLFLAAMNGEL